MTSGITESLFFWGAQRGGGGRPSSGGPRGQHHELLCTIKSQWGQGNGVGGGGGVGGGRAMGDPWCEWGGGACPQPPHSYATEYDILKIVLS